MVVMYGYKMMWLTAKIHHFWHSGCIYTYRGGVAHAWGRCSRAYLSKRLTQCITNSRTTMKSLTFLDNNTLSISLSHTETAHYLGNAQEIGKRCTTIAMTTETIPPSNTDSFYCVLPPTNNPKRITNHFTKD